MKHNLTKYNEFINQCRLKDYSDMITHKHHIKPLSQRGKDIDENIIILSCQDHYQAHWILAHCYPKDHHYRRSNLRACGLLFEWANNPEECRRAISESRKGILHTEEHKKKISQSLPEDRDWETMG